MMKRILILGFVTLLFTNCGGNDTEIVKPEPEVVETVLAKDDSFQALENTVIELPSFLTNDEFTPNSIDVAFDETTTSNGTIEKEGNLYTYTPANDFLGNDTFTYTICSS